MKKRMLAVLVMAFLTLMASSFCFAEVTGVADTSKEGSLLMWPLIQTNDGNETYIIITNSEKGDGNETPVDIKCYWETREYPAFEGAANYCTLSDMLFTLSMNNPLIFRASDGSGMDGRGLVPGIGTGMKGALKCWAVDPTDQNQISWNHLSGYAVIADGNATAFSRAGITTPNKTAWQYSAWRFAANVVTDQNGTNFADGFWVGKTTDGNANYNELKLRGARAVVSDPANCPTGTTGIRLKSTTYYCVTKVNSDNCQYPYDLATYPLCYKPTGVYDACPSYLTFDFLAEPQPNVSPVNGWAYNHLVVLPCKEDLRSEDDASGVMDYYTRLAFTVWNENEVKYTGMQACAHCGGTRDQTYEKYLGTLYNGKVNYFQAASLHTDSGRFRVEGLGGGKCGADAKKTPLVGVMATTIVKAGTNGAMKSVDIVGTTPTINGAVTAAADAGYIWWNPAGGVEKKKK
jgi:hypothetical protein